ncbi:hypothetical protein [uncultured Roseobacter sp.]|uniref:hypothetical protein n=1 Tax=uncultured Roseobacter sp. TaxID=114847 RepID=UPI00261C4F4B|nr:hypothetical protein [uncultured Roseobacter sp.]
MVCFCKTPAATIPSRISPSFSMALPQVPLQMQLALAFPAITPENRLDMALSAYLGNLNLPTLSLPSGGLFQIAPQLALIAGTFPLMDLPALELSLQQMGDTLVTNVWPLTGWLASLKLGPLLNFALAARLVLDLRALGIDAFAMDYTMPAVQYPGHHFRMSLPRPQLHMARILMGLPSLFSLTETFQLPTLGENGSFPGMMSALQGLAGIKPPKLGISLPQLSKLALVLNALATIKLAFGDIGLSGAGLAPIRAMMRFWGALPFPMPPMPALALHADLDALPSLDSVQLGASMATPAMFAPIMGFSMPQIGFLPVANLMLGLGASLQIVLDMEPLDACSLCPFS